MNFESLFELDVPFLELFVRGTTMYLVLFAAFRILGRRESGSIGLSDLLVTVLIADASQNGMTGEYKSISSGIVVAFTIMFWASVIDYFSFNYPSFRKISEHPALLVVRNGRMVSGNCKREQIDRDDLLHQARKAGLKELEDVHEMYLESNGEFSVIKSEN